MNCDFKYINLVLCFNKPYNITYIKRITFFKFYILSYIMIQSWFDTEHNVIGTNIYMNIYT